MGAGESGSWRFSECYRNENGLCSSQGDSGTGEHVPEVVSESVDGAGGSVGVVDGVGCLSGGGVTKSEYRRRLKGRKCYVGLDLSSTKDLTASVGVFPDDDGFDVLAQFFVPKDNIKERSTRDRVPYEQWS